jgi:site-specific DNA recombinase
MSKDTDKQLRFAALIRVSTEKQEKKGESLGTQRSQIEQAVASLGGNITRWYAGQEHATEGYERQLLEQLLSEAAKPKNSRAFDAVMVADPSRWSRDNIKSEIGLDLLRDNKVAYYSLTTLYDLFDPNMRMVLSQFSTIGAWQARVQKQKSLLNRIGLAKRGIPSVGGLPFGRIYDRKTGKWSIDPKKQAMIEDVARRCLAGESMQKVAAEYGVNHPHLCKILRLDCGTIWNLNFRADNLNINETVPMTMPELLPEATIKAVRLKLEDNMKRLNGRPAHDYLLNGRIFCASCGYLMTGQEGGGGDLYYRHATHPKARKCPIVNPRPWVRADKIEGQVILQLFNMFGNPTAIERAIKAAVPDCDKALKRRRHLEEELAKVGKARDRILSYVAKDTLTDEQAEKQLRELKERESGLQGEMDKLSATLADVPDEESLRVYVEKVDGLIFLHDEGGNFGPGDGSQYAGGNTISSLLAMTQEDRRRLIRAVFDTPLADGTPAGVYVSQDGYSKPRRPKKWTFTIRGRLEFESVMGTFKARGELGMPIVGHSFGG